ncbi:MAG TPA: magnesium chelatase [Planctomycetota bacterium]|nr:magnesium chelatase [Planctomycetota bacterium]
MAAKNQQASTLGELVASGWRSRRVKHELRDNLIAALASKAPLFPGIVGYDRTVLRDVQNAILSCHDFILLGLRGQAKTRILRSLTALLDEAIPAIEGCEVRDDPLRPICAACRERVRREGDATRVTWIARGQRYHEKLATPDVTIADLIGDLDPIKAAARQTSLADPEVVHFGLLPRSNRGIFAINELPDLPPRIQVGLLNILEEGDVQIRGFPLRLELDLALCFSANPEDYTHRGSIITPLRDRIGSQILTHYPKKLEEAALITDQESWIERGASVEVRTPPWLRRAIEEVAIQGRASEFVDQSSGVSARLSIALYESVVSNAERRALLTGSERVVARTADLLGAGSAIHGKVELVYEGEREGPAKVAQHLLGKALKAVFDDVAPAPSRLEKSSAKDMGRFDGVLAHFQKGAVVDLADDLSGKELLQRLSAVGGLREVAAALLHPEGDEELAAAMEFVLEGLHQNAMVAREELLGGRVYRDSFEEMVRSLKKD